MSVPMVVAGGGSGGHVFPGLAVVRELQALGAEAHWLGARNGPEVDLVSQRGIPLTLVALGAKAHLTPTATVEYLVRMPQAIPTAVRFLLRLQPAAVLGVGGPASPVGIVAAGLLGIPCVLQEQNAVPGRSVRLLAGWADLICCGFTDAPQCFPSQPAEWSGNPVRRQFFEVAPSAISDPPRVLVLGGSQGSLFLNRMLPRALAALRDQGTEPQVRHQAGVRWAEVVRTSYRDLKLEAEVNAFLSEPWQALAEADLVVARSGALTVSELAAAGRAAVLIPFPGSVGNRQEHNARAMERAGGAVVMTEDESTPERLAALLGELLDAPPRLGAMGDAARATALPDAAHRIASRLLAVGGAA